METKQNGHVMKHTNWVDSHPMIITARYGSLVMKKMQFKHFFIISLLELSVAMSTKPRGKSAENLVNTLAVTFFKQSS